MVFIQEWPGQNQPEEQKADPQSQAGKDEQIIADLENEEKLKNEPSYKTFLEQQKQIMNMYQTQNKNELQNKVAKMDSNQLYDYFTDLDLTIQQE